MEPNLQVIPVHEMNLWMVPPEIRVSIWYSLKITDFGSLLLVSRSFKNFLEKFDLKYMALTAMKLKGLNEATSVSDIKKALAHAHQANKIFASRFLPSFSSFLIALHEQVECHSMKDPDIQLIRKSNALSFPSPKIRNRFFLYLTPSFKSLLATIGKSETQHTRLALEKDEMSVHLQDILENDDLCEEFVKSNYDIQKVLESFEIKNYEKAKYEEQIKKFLGLCAIFKFFKCTPNDLRQQSVIQTDRELLVDKWDIIHKVLSLGGEASLTKWLQIDKGKRFHMVQSSVSIIKLVQAQIFKFSSLADCVSPGNLCEAHKMHQALTILCKGMTDPVRMIFLKEPKLVESMYQQSIYMQALIDNHHLTLDHFLKVDAEDRQNFVTYSREILRLCQHQIMRIDQLFTISPTLIKEWLKNINHLSNLAAYWELSLSNHNLFDALKNQPRMMEFVLSHASLLLHYVMKTELSFKEFIENFEKVLMEIEGQRTELEKEAAFF